MVTQAAILVGIHVLVPCLVYVSFIQLTPTSGIVLHDLRNTRVKPSLGIPGMNEWHRPLRTRNSDLHNLIQRLLHENVKINLPLFVNLA